MSTSPTISPAARRRALEPRLKAYSQATSAVLALGTAAAAQAQTVVHNIAVAGPLTVAIDSLAAFPTSSNHAFSAYNLANNHSLLPGASIKLYIYQRNVLASDGGKIVNGGAILNGTNKFRPQEMSGNVLRTYAKGVAIAGGHGGYSALALRTFAQNSSGGGLTYGQRNGPAIATGRNAYIGFSFIHGQHYYGWLRVRLDVDENGRAISFGFVPVDGIVGAYALAGVNLAAGDTAPVPEPANIALGLGLMALGAVGVREHRRRLRATRESAAPAS